MDVTVAISPRERFRQLPASLRSLFTTIDKSIPVIVVEGGAPGHIRRELRAIRAERPFELIESKDFVLPNTAKNIALGLARTKYIAYCDNDIFYTPGWLEALVGNAETNKATAVAPLTVFGPTEPTIIHHAGGMFELRTDSAGRRILHDKHNYSYTPLAEAEAEDFRQAPLHHWNFEYHCALVEVQAMRAVGGHDERMVVHDHLDSSLRLLMNGGRLTFERRARVTFNAFEPFRKEDWPYFLHRFAPHRAEASERAFAENWGVYKDLSQTRHGFIKKHRERAMRTALPRLPKALDRRKIRDGMLKLYTRWVWSLDRHQPDDPAPVTLPKPPPDALERAGIPLAGIPQAGQAQGIPDIRLRAV